MREPTNGGPNDFERVELLHTAISGDHNRVGRPVSGLAEPAREAGSTMQIEILSGAGQRRHAQEHQDDG